MSAIFESDVEQFVIELLQNQGFDYLAPEQQEAERANLSEVVLLSRLKDSMDRLNPALGAEVKEQAIRLILNPPSQNLIDNNEAFHKLLTEGVEVEFMKEGNLRGGKVKLVDFDEVRNNDFLVCNQFTVTEQNLTKRPDVVLFINGLPLVVIELKNPADEVATVAIAFTQLSNYKKAIPSLFHYNSILIASDGLDARAGTISSDFGRFAAWKSVDGVREDRKTIPQVETLIRGMLNKKTLLDLVKQFIVFEKTRKEVKKTGLTSVVTVKKLAGYHQYFAVRKAVDSTLTAAKAEGDGKVGVVWHTQGSGKSLSMVFYTGKVVLSMDNPTVVVITDRNDLDDQLFDTFAGCRQLLRQEPVQAANRDHLKGLLKTAGGGIVFTTIQKFSPADGGNVYEQLSERKNIVVIADEAHRTQYGFKPKTINVKDEKGNTVGKKIVYGFAKYLRDALPHASFIGFTATPIEKEDVSTPAVF